MMRGHDIFESLAGAIALGEATDAESAKFALHAADCDRCRPDLDFVPARVTTALRGLEEQETWRPSVRDGVNAAIAVRRRNRTRVFGSAIATAAAFSIALNVGFSTGNLGRLMAHFTRAAAEPTPVALVPKIPPAASGQGFVEAAVVPVRPMRHHHVIPHVRTVVKPAAAAVPADDDANLPSLDVLSGLAIDPEAEKKAPHVAKADTGPPSAEDTPAADGGASP